MKKTLSCLLLINCALVAHAASCAGLLPELQLQAVHLGEIKTKGKVLPGVQCIYQSKSKQQYKHFHKGYYFNLDNPDSAWQEAKNHKFRSCQIGSSAWVNTVPELYQVQDNQCQFHELINWP